MAKYLSVAKEVARDVEAFASMHELNKQAKAELVDLIFKAAKGLPHMGNTHKLKVNYIEAIARDVEGVECKRVMKEGRDDRRYETAMISPEIKSGNPFGN